MLGANASIINKEPQKNARWYYGETLKALRLKSQMLVYSALAETISVTFCSGVLQIEVPENKLTECLKLDENIKILTDIAISLGIKISVSTKKDDSDMVVEKLKQLFGDKLVIK